MAVCCMFIVCSSLLYISVYSGLLYIRVYGGLLYIIFFCNSQQFFRKEYISRTGKRKTYHSPYHLHLKVREPGHLI